MPFDIPGQALYCVEHFTIVLPVIILLIEFYNLFTRRKSVGGFSFILIVLAVLAFAISYFIGTGDNKEAYNLLSTEGQSVFNKYTLLGTYLLLASVVLLFFKLLAMTGKGFFKFLFFVVLIGLIWMTLNQGKLSNELTYTHGLNVKKATMLDIHKAPEVPKEEKKITIEEEKVDMGTASQGTNDVNLEDNTVDTLHTEEVIEDKPIEVESQKEENTSLLPKSKSAIDAIASDLEQLKI